MRRCLATKLIHLPDEPAGVGQIVTQTVELRRAHHSPDDRQLLHEKQSTSSGREDKGRLGRSLPAGNARFQQPAALIA